MDHGLGTLAVVQQGSVQRPDMLGAQVPQCDLAHARGDVDTQVSFIRDIRGLLYSGPLVIEPPDDQLLQQHLRRGRKGARIPLVSELVELRHGLPLGLPVHGYPLSVDG